MRWRDELFRARVRSIRLRDEGEGYVPRLKTYMAEGGGEESTSICWPLMVEWVETVELSCASRSGNRLVKSSEAQSNFKDVAKVVGNMSRRCKQTQDIPDELGLFCGHARPWETRLVRVLADYTIGFIGAGSTRALEWGEILLDCTPHLFTIKSATLHAADSSKHYQCTGVKCYSTVVAVCALSPCSAPGEDIT